MQLRVTYFPFELLYSKPRDASLVRAASCAFAALGQLVHTAIEAWRVDDGQQRLFKSFRMTGNDAH